LLSRISGMDIPFSPPLVIIIVVIIIIIIIMALQP
jgi:hypothetical protein